MGIFPTVYTRGIISLYGGDFSLGERGGLYRGKNGMLKPV